MAVMKGFWGTGPENLSRIRVVMVDENDQNRDNGMAALIGLGCDKAMVTGCGSMAEAEKIMRQEMVDLLIIDHDPTPDATPATLTQIIHRIRHGHLGINPFVIVIVTVSSRQIKDISKLLFIGADDVVIKPLNGKVLAERVEYNAVHRRPFVVTSNYIGPDRRADDDRPSDIPQFEVPNTLLYQMTGVDQLSDMNNKAKIRATIEAISNARLEQHAQSLAVLSHLIIETSLSRFDGGERSAPTRSWLRVMLSLLRDVQRIGQNIDQHALAELACSLRQKIQQMIRRSRRANPAENASVSKDIGIALMEVDILFLRDLVDAVTMTMGMLTVPNPDICMLARSYRRHNAHPQPPTISLNLTPDQ